MSRAAKIVLALVAVLLLLGAAAGAIFWKRPLATLAWLGRRRLSAAGFEKHFQTSAVGPQCVFSGGGGGAVVLVHGAGDQAGGWAKIAPRLAKSFAVVAVDLAGHGESAPAEGPLPFATLLAGFDGAMKELPQGKVTLVGNSLGAWVATVWAKEHPGEGPAPRPRERRAAPRRPARPHAPAEEPRGGGQDARGPARPIGADGPGLRRRRHHPRRRDRARSRGSRRNRRA